MTGHTADRLKRVYARLDELTARMIPFHAQLSKLVNGAHEKARQAFNACQFCTAAGAALSGVRQVLFNSHTIPCGSQAATDANVEWFSERIDGLAPALGLPCSFVEQSIIAAADVQLDHAERLLDLALSASRAIL